MRNVVLTLVVAIAAIGVIGCSDDTPTAPSGDLPALRTIPQDGASGFDPTDSIHIMFNEPMDTIQFHEWFYCIDSVSHDALMDSLQGGMMGMGHDHEDSAAFYGRMHDRDVDGEFHWFDGADSCVFHPESPLEDRTAYVLYFRHEMMNQRGGHMQHMGRDLREDLIIRFHTD